MAKTEYAEISNQQAISLLGYETGLMYLMNNIFKIYQARNGQYCIKYERRKYTTTNTIDSYGYSANYLAQVVKEMLGCKDWEENNG